MREQFCISVSYRCQVLQRFYEEEGEMDIETEWSRSKKAWIEERKQSGERNLPTSIGCHSILWK